MNIAHANAKPKLTLWIKRYPVTTGFVLMFLFTWPAYLQRGLFVGYGLALAALLTACVANGRAGARALLGRYLLWRVSPGWYFVALFLPLALTLTAISFHRLWSGLRPDWNNVAARQIFGRTGALWPFVVPFFLVDAVTNGEEIGWRGFALPRLQARYSALVASIIVGLIWGFWHLPRYLPSGDFRGVYLTILHTIPSAIVFTWIYNSTGGSLLLATLFHAANNTAFVFLPVGAQTDDLSQPVMSVGVELVAASLLVWFTGARQLSRRERVQVAQSPSPGKLDTVS